MNTMYENKDALKHTGYQCPLFQKLILRLCHLTSGHVFCEEYEQIYQLMTFLDLEKGCDCAPQHRLREILQNYGEFGSYGIQFIFCINTVIVVRTSLAQNQSHWVLVIEGEYCLQSCLHFHFY